MTTGTTTKLSLLACAVAFGLVAACAPSTYPEYQVDVDTAFTNDELAIVVDALAEWETRTAEVGGPVRFYVRSTAGVPDELEANGIYIHRAGLDGSCPDNARGLHPSRAGSAYSARGGFFECVDAERWPAFLFRIVLHETGHVLGLEHSDKGTVMATDVGIAAEHLTDADMAQFCEVSGLCP